MSLKNLHTFLLGLTLLSFIFLSCNEEDITTTTSDEDSNEDTVMITCTNTDITVTSPIEVSTNFNTQPTILLFDRDSVRFSGEFNQEVTWAITITGLSHPTKHAIKQISRTSNKLDPEIDFWGGESDNIYFFKRDEEVQIKIDFCGIQDTTINLGSFVIRRTTIFNDVLIMNFEDIDTKHALISRIHDINTFFDTDGGDEFIAADITREPALHPELNLPHPIEGNSYAHLHGKDIIGTPQPTFIGGINTNTLSFGLDGSLEELFVNFYAHSNGNTNTKLRIEIPGANAEVYYKDIDVTWTGWKLVSFRLSEFTLTEPKPLGPGFLRDDFIKKISINLFSGNGPGHEAEILIDYVTFTKGTPFSQSK